MIGRQPTEEECRLWQRYLERMSEPVPVPTHSPPKPRTACVLDLHGMTAAEAYAAFCAFVAGGKGGYKYLTVVTGKSGVIRREFEHWTANCADIRRVDTLNGGGAFRVYLRKSDG
jgi:hypothetical protein